MEDGRGTSALFAGKGKPAVTYPAHPALFRLGVVAADLALADVEAELLADGRRRARLAAGLERLREREHWAVIVIDVPPALGGLSDAALRAADAVLVPVAADFLALDALRSTLAAVRAVEKARGGAYAPLAVLPTFVDRRRATADAVALLQEQFGDLLLARRHPAQRPLRRGRPVGRAGGDRRAPERAGDRLRRGGGSARRGARRRTEEGQGHAPAGGQEVRAGRHARRAARRSGASPPRTAAS